MKRYDKVLFVCKSNTAQSPMAEAIAQHALLLEDILIESRGLVVLFPEPINPKAEAVLVSNGLTMKGYTSRALERTDFDRRTLVVTMTSDQKEKLLSEFENAENVWSLPEYIESREEVFDPYGGSLAEYGQCFEQLHFMIEVFAEKLRQEE